MDRIEPADAGWTGCDSTISRDSLQRTALGARWSIRRLAAEYQVSEGNLRIAVANASPDLSIGPGMFYDQGTGKFTLAAALPSLPLNRNRGPIAEAEAERSTAGARLVREQEVVLGEVDAALAGCQAARQSVASAESLSRQANTRVSLADSAYARGETGRLELAAARLDALRARRLTVEAGLGLRRAGLVLDRSVGAWGTQRDGAWPARWTESSRSNQ
jgi:outer membrane protein TolC